MKASKSVKSLGSRPQLLWLQRSLQYWLPVLRVHHLADFDTAQSCPGTQETNKRFTDVCFPSQAGTLKEAQGQRPVPPSHFRQYLTKRALLSSHVWWFFFLLNHTVVVYSIYRYVLYTIDIYRCLYFSYTVCICLNLRPMPGAPSSGSENSI